MEMDNYLWGQCLIALCISNRCSKKCGNENKQNEKEKKLMLESDIPISMPCYVIHGAGVYYICFQKN